MNAGKMVVMLTAVSVSASGFAAKWTSMTGGDFSAEENWEDGLVPTSADSATFQTDNSAPIYLSKNATVSTFTFATSGGHTNVLNLNGHTLSATGNTAKNFYSTTPNATFVVKGGGLLSMMGSEVVNVYSCSVAGGAYSGDFDFHLQGQGTRMTTTPREFYFGYWGTCGGGRLFVEDGAEVSVSPLNWNSRVVIGQAVPNNSLRVLSGGRFITASRLVVGGTTQSSRTAENNSVIVRGEGSLVDVTTSQSFVLGLDAVRHNHNWIEVSDHGVFSNSYRWGATGIVGGDGYGNYVVVSNRGNFCINTNFKIGDAATASNNWVDVSDNSFFEIIQENVSTNFFVGYKGKNNRLTVRGKSMLKHPTSGIYRVYVGYDATSTGNRVTVDDSEFSTYGNGMYVGYNGADNHFLACGGATVNVGWNPADLGIGYGAGADNCSLTCSNATIAAGTADVFIGRSGSNAALYMGGTNTYLSFPSAKCFYATNSSMVVFNVEAAGFVRNQISGGDFKFANSTFKVNVKEGDYKNLPKSMKRRITLVKSSKTIDWDDATMTLDYDPALCTIERTEKQIDLCFRGTAGGMIILR